MIPLSLAGAVTAFRWARESFGETSDWIVLVLWTFDPNILGNGELVAPDLGGSSMGLVAGYLLWRWLGQPNWSRAFFAGGGLGLALLSKSTLLILGPLWVVSWGVYRWRQGTLRVRWRPEARQLALVLILAVYFLNLGYGFSGTGTRFGLSSFPELSGETGRLAKRPATGFVGHSWNMFPCRCREGF